MYSALLKESPPAPVVEKLVGVQRVERSHIAVDDGLSPLLVKLIDVVCSGRNCRHRDECN